MLLAGDIGGTKSRLAIYRKGNDPKAPLREEVLASNCFPSIEALIEAFLKDHREPLEAAALAVAGPVIGGRATVTNLPWIADAGEIRQAFGLASVVLVNDLAATARAVALLSPSECHLVQAGEPAAGGTIAVIAPGTGLGEAFLIQEGSRFTAQASQGGHADFAPANRLEIELLAAAWEEAPHVSWEHFCSGPGIGRIYRFLRDRGMEEPAWLAERLALGDDPAPVITGAALTERDGLCLKTLRLFLSLLGAEAGNLALKTLALGGLYIGGGIVPRLLPLLGEGGFLKAFTAKGPMADLLRRLPVRVILDPRAALLGAADLGLNGR